MVIIKIFWWLNICCMYHLSYTLFLCSICLWSNNCKYHACFILHGTTIKRGIFHEGFGRVLVIDIERRSATSWSNKQKQHNAQSESQNTVWIAIVVVAYICVYSLIWGIRALTFWEYTRSFLLIAKKWEWLCLKADCVKWSLHFLIKAAGVMLNNCVWKYHLNRARITLTLLLLMHWIGYSSFHLALNDFVLTFQVFFSYNTLFLSLSLSYARYSLLCWLILVI